MKKKRAVAKEVYTLADLRNWHDVDPPIRLGVFGDPVEHSLSPQIQNAALKHCKIDMQYARFHILPDELREAIDLIRKLEFVGVNLTIPHKIGALELVDTADENVKRIGAVNVIKVEDGKLRGFNTDGRGFARAIREEFSVDLRDLRVMILGAGALRARSRSNARKKTVSGLSSPIARSKKRKSLPTNYAIFLPARKCLARSRAYKRSRWKKRRFDSKSEMSI